MADHGISAASDSRCRPRLRRLKPTSIHRTPEKATINFRLNLNIVQAPRFKRHYASTAWAFFQRDIDGGHVAKARQRSSPDCAEKGKYPESRNDALRIIHAFGGNTVARRLWGKLTVYSHRFKVESAFSSLKRLFGGRLFSRRFDALSVEMRQRALAGNIWISCATQRTFAT